MFPLHLQCQDPKKESYLDYRVFLVLCLTLGSAGGIKSDILFHTFTKYRLNSSPMFCGCVTVSLLTPMFKTDPDPTKKDPGVIRICLFDPSGLKDSKPIRIQQKRIQIRSGSASSQPRYNNRSPVRSLQS